MKVIFLDIDGVMNCEQSALWEQKNGIPVWDTFWTRSVVALNELLRRTGAKLVISSSWRMGATVESMQELMDAQSVEGEVVGMTPDLSETNKVGPIFIGVERGVEIATWLSENEVESFVILDDDPDMCDLKPWLVLTDWGDNGFHSDHLDQALEALNKTGWETAVEATLNEQS